MRENDYNWCTEGELVILPTFTCSDEKADGRCGCARGLGGAASHRATTTALVAETDLTPQQWLHCVALSLAEQGWATSPDNVDPQLVDAHRRLLDEVQHYELGAVVEYRDGVLAARTTASGLPRKSA